MARVKQLRTYCHVCWWQETTDLDSRMRSMCPRCASTRIHREPVMVALGPAERTRKRVAKRQAEIPT